MPERKCFSVVPHRKLILNILILEYQLVWHIFYFGAHFMFIEWNFQGFLLTELDT